MSKVSFKNDNIREGKLMGRREIPEEEYVKMIQDEYNDILRKIKEDVDSLPISIQEINGCQNFIMKQLIKHSTKLHDLIIILEDYRGMKRYKDREVKYFMPEEKPNCSNNRKRIYS